jgi:DNA sulfur modification protein DndD
MKILSVTMTNFMPYKGECRIDFPTDEYRNVMIVFGDNMRGKTSFLNALRWGFYGRAYGRHLREIPLNDLLNKDAASAGDYCLDVRIRFEAAGHSYSLHRRADRREHVGIPSRPEDFSVQVSLQKEDIVLPGHLITAEINRYVPEQVSRFFLFDGELLQEYETLLMEGNEQGKHIKNAIEQVLGVPTLIRGRDEAETILRSAQRQQSKEMAQVKSLSALAEHQLSLQERQGAKKRAIEKLKEQQKEIRTQRDGLDDELEKVEDIYRAQTESKTLKRRQNEIVNRLEQVAEERMELARKAWIDLVQPKLQVKQEQLKEDQERIYNNMDERGRIEVNIESLTKLLNNEPCPTCGQLPLEENLSDKRAELAQYEKKLLGLKKVHDDLAIISSEIRDIDRLLRPGVGERMQSLKAEERTLSVELTKIDNEVDKIDERIRGYDTQEIISKRNLRDMLIRQEGQLDSEISKTDAEIKGIRNELEILSKQISSQPAARQRRSTVKVELGQGLVTVFTQSIERLRDSLRSKVEERATEAFKRLTTQAKYRGLVINENYGLTILDEKGDKVGVRSAGAEQIVALSLIDGLARTGRAAGPVVMDTPFGRLDLKHRDNILRYLPETTSQLVLLVHDGEIRKDTDLAPVASRIGKEYYIREVSIRQSKIEVMRS